MSTIDVYAKCNQPYYCDNAFINSILINVIGSLPERKISGFVLFVLTEFSFYLLWVFYLVCLFLIVIPEFISQVNIALESLSKNTVHLFDDNQFVDVSKKVYDTIHTIRCSVMMIRVSFWFVHLKFIFKIVQGISRGT